MNHTRKTGMTRKAGIHTPWSLASILSISLIALSVGALILAGGLQLSANIGSLKTAVSERLDLIAGNAAGNVRNFMNEHFQIMETAVKLNDLGDVSAARQKETLEGIMGLLPSLRQAAFLDVHGRMLARSSRVSVAASGAIAERFRRDAPDLLRPEQRYVGPIAIDQNSFEPMALIAIRVNDILGREKGTMVGEVNLMFMWDLVKHLRVSGNGLAYVVDRRGRLIAFPDSARVLRGENASHTGMVRSFLENGSLVPPDSAGIQRGIRGSGVVGTYIPLSSPDWAVVIELPWEEAYREIIRDILISLAIMAFVSVTAVACGVYLARRLNNPIVHLMETATRIAAGERGLRAKTGGPREVSVMAAAFNSMTDELHRAMKNLEQTVDERTRQLEIKAAGLAAANQDLESFSYSVSHDLRAPLRAINGYTRMLMEGHAPRLGEEGKRLCRVVCDESQRMSALIDNLLAISRMGRAEMRSTVIDMSAMAEDTFRELTTPEERKRIDWHVAPLIPAVGDATLIHQVWLNLVGNAIKYTSKKKRAVIAVACRKDEDETVYSVIDNGCGFDMRYAGKLFGVFQRLHHENDFPGTGVGLAIAHRAVVRHGGRIWAESEPNKGSVFYFSLPAPARSAGPDADKH